MRKGNGESCSISFVSYVLALCLTITSPGIIYLGALPNRPRCLCTPLESDSYAGRTYGEASCIFVRMTVSTDTSCGYACSLQSTYGR